MNSHRGDLKRKYPDCWRWVSLARRIPGQLGEDEANALFQLTRFRAPAIDPVIVELGAGRGQASLLLAAGLCGKVRPRLFCIPGAAGGNETAAQADRCALERNLRRCRLSHIVGTIAGHPRGVSADWKCPIDFLFIHAAQDGAASNCDPSLWLPFVKAGGLVVLQGGLADLQAPHYAEFRQVGSLAWAVKRCAGRIPAPTEVPCSTREIERLRRLLNSSIDVMMRLNGPLTNQEHMPARPIAHLEDAAEMAKARLQDYVRFSAKELAETRHAIEALRRSWSWRLTAPLRFGVEMLQAFGGLVESLVHGSPKARVAGFAQWMLFRRQIHASGLLDERYYRINHAGVAWAQTNPLLHFFVRGARQGDKPNELFDIGYYLGRYPDAAASGLNPLVHYLKVGAYRGFDPHPHFDSSFYLEQNPDVREAVLNPLAHYLHSGIVEGRDPNPWFDTSEYLEQNPDVVDFLLNPLSHQAESRR